MSDFIPGMVSVIIPVYNRGSLVAESIASVLEQTWRPVEVILVDDGSTDDTPRCLDDFAVRYPELVRVIHMENAGPGAARERGERQARGEFIQYLDSDDLLIPDKFASQIEGLRQNPECGISYGATLSMDEDGTISREPNKWTAKRIDYMFPGFISHRWWNTSTPLYRVELIKRASGWLHTYNEEDWEHDCRIAAQKPKLHFIPRVVSIHRNHSGDRLCIQGTSHAARESCLKARKNIAVYAEQAGFSAGCQEMVVFARASFLLARQAGAEGNASAAKGFHQIACRAMGPRLASAYDLRLYGAIASLVGWRLSGLFSLWVDRIRGGIHVQEG